MYIDMLTAFISLPACFPSNISRNTEVTFPVSGLPVGPEVEADGFLSCK